MEQHPNDYAEGELIPADALVYNTKRAIWIKRAEIASGTWRLQRVYLSKAMLEFITLSDAEVQALDWHHARCRWPNPHGQHPFKHCLCLDSLRMPWAQRSSKP